LSNILLNPYTFVAGEDTNRGVFINQDDIEYIDPVTSGNAQTFGTVNMPQNIDGGASAGNATYGVAGGTYGGTLARWSFAILDSSVDWGDMDRARKDTSGCSNDTLMTIAGGYASSDWWTWIDSVSIDGAGSASDFGSLTVKVYGGASLSSDTRAVFGGGYNGSLAGITTQSYVTFASGGTAIVAGALIGSTNWLMTGCSNSTTGIWAGGYNASNQMKKITMASLGTAVDYGDLAVGRHNSGNVPTETRATFGGGGTNQMDQKNFDDSGNCTDFGDLGWSSTTCGCSDLVRS
tara:strand:+ start:1053 stop:1928 length:876 start_codon:yes stop_codon:yes gene_type:complete